MWSATKFWLSVAWLLTSAAACSSRIKYEPDVQTCTPLAPGVTQPGSKRRPPIQVSCLQPATDEGRSTDMRGDAQSPALSDAGRTSDGNGGAARDITDLGSGNATCPAGEHHLGDDEIDAGVGERDLGDDDIDAGVGESDLGDDDVDNGSGEHPIDVGVGDSGDPAGGHDAETTPTTSTSTMPAPTLPGRPTLSFSHSPGFYTAPFQLELQGSAEAADIYYTLDGSLPDPNAALAPICEGPGQVLGRTFVYDDALDVAELLTRANRWALFPTNAPDDSPPWSEPQGSVPKSVVVRAQAVLDGEASPVVSGSFFVELQGRARYGLPVVSLLTNPGNLFDEELGIYVVGSDTNAPNYVQRGEDWERPAFFELFDDSGERPLHQELGVRIRGGTTRKLPQKSMTAFARSEYGNNTLDYRFFATKDTDTFKRIILWNGANDWTRSMMRDAVFQRLVHHLPFETQHSQPSIVFINGEYWGIHSLRERLDQHHLERAYGMRREYITILEINSALVEGSTEDAESHREFLRDLAAGKIEHVEDFESVVALSELLDYTIAQVYAGNTDWPHNNIAYWRYSGPDPSTTSGVFDGRWRYLMYDVDRSFGLNSGVDKNMIAYLFKERAEHWSRRLFRGFIGFETARHEFIQRLAIHLATTFETQRVSAELDAYADDLMPELPDHMKRWNVPVSIERFQREMDKSHDFANRRAGFVRDHVLSFFDEVTGLATIRVTNLEPNSAVTIHGIELSPATPGVVIRDGVWEATVFAGVPVVLDSSEVDLTLANLTGDGGSQVSGQSLRISLEPDAVVEVALP